MSEATAPHPNDHFDGVSARAISDMAARVRDVEKLNGEQAWTIREQAGDLKRLTEKVDEMEDASEKLRESTVPLKDYERLMARIGQVVMAVVLGFIGAVAALIYGRGGLPR